MTYYFIFSKTALLLQRQADGTHTIPCTEEVPIKTHPWTHIMNITPMEDGTEVKTFNIEDPEHLDILDDELKASGYDFIGLRESFYHLPSSFTSKPASARNCSTGIITRSSAVSAALR